MDWNRRIVMGAVLAAMLAAAPAGGGSVAGGNSTVRAGTATEAVLFYAAGGAVALFAVGCVLSVNIVRMAACLFGALGSVAVLYFLLGAYFVGAIQLIVYAGGTLVVIIFGVMLTSTSPGVRFEPKLREIIAGAAVFAALFAGLASVLGRVSWRAGPPEPPAPGAAEIGQALLTTYLVPFELASVLLLAVMIGAAMLARPERRE